MKKLEDEFEESINGLVDQEPITEDPPTIGGGTGAPERPKQK